MPLNVVNGREPDPARPAWGMQARWEWRARPMRMLKRSHVAMRHIVSLTTITRLQVSHEFQTPTSTPAEHRVAGGVELNSVSIMLDVMSRQACGVISPLTTGARNHTLQRSMPWGVSCNSSYTRQLAAEHVGSHGRCTKPMT